jgi:uncharacterized protein (DUF362 family)
MSGEHKNNKGMAEFSRRDFLRLAGLAGVGLLMKPAWPRGDSILWAGPTFSTSSATVAVTEAFSYDRALIRQKVQHLFESIGGLSDLVGQGKRVAIKLNLTGGSGTSRHSRLQGVDIRETMWTHPEVVRAIGELLIDSGVRPSDIYIVEALWDAASYANFGYADVQRALGAQFVDLNTAPFIQKPVGESHFRFESFVLNRILAQIDVYVSVPKLKHHYEAGLTGALKNQIGITPLQYYKRASTDGNRSKLHYGQDSEDVGTHLPRAICDLNLARPVHLAVIDGIKNAFGGEGAWNPTFVPAESHVLLAGKDPVATDAVAALLLGLNPELEQLPLPDRVRRCDNHLELMRQCGVGTNRLAEIQVVGDGAWRVTGVETRGSGPIPDRPRLLPNYPNPFNASTAVRFEMPVPSRVELEVFNGRGRKVATLYEGWMPAGLHEIRWEARELPSGVYFCRLQSREFVDTAKLLLQK